MISLIVEYAKLTARFSSHYPIRYASLEFHMNRSHCWNESELQSILTNLYAFPPVSLQEILRLALPGLQHRYIPLTMKRITLLMAYVLVQSCPTPTSVWDIDLQEYNVLSPTIPALDQTRRALDHSLSDCFHSIGDG
jgi:hypothetical protein